MTEGESPNAQNGGTDSVGVRVLVFSSLFPSAGAPHAGSFIKERMFRVGRMVPIVVVSPQPWSPFDAVIRRFRPSFRPTGSRHEVVDGVDVYRPRFLSVPGILKCFDGWSMGFGALRTCRRVAHRFRPTVIDAHFAYPDGFAAVVIGRRLGLPAMITLRGSKDAWLLGTRRERYVRAALAQAGHVVAVSDSLKDGVAMRLGQPPERVTVIGNGVDSCVFRPMERDDARDRLAIPRRARVLVTVGGLTENKGFHRVISLLPTLRRRVPGLLYLVVGGATSKGDQRAALERQVAELGLTEIVRFCGPQPAARLPLYYGAADVFVLATAYEGWANVLLEAMSCGLPVVTTDVGGNRQVVPDRRLGTLVPFWDPEAFEDAVAAALDHPWDRSAIRAYAESNSWQRRVDAVIARLRVLSERR